MKSKISTRALALLAFTISCNVTYADNLQDYLADGIREWNFSGNYSVTQKDETNTQNLPVILTLRSQPTQTGMRYTYEVSNDVALETRTEALSYSDAGYLPVEFATPFYTQLVAASQKVMFPWTELTGSYATKLNSPNHRVDAQVTYTLQGLVDFTFNNSTHKALKIERMIEVTQYSDEKNENYKYDLLGKVDELQVIHYIKGYGPVSIEVTRTLQTAATENAGLLDTTLIHYKVALTSQVNSPIFADALKISNADYYSEWFGLFDATNFPIIKHANLGNIEVVNNNSNTFWVKFPDGLGWGSTSKLDFPKFYFPQVNNYLTADMVNSTPKSLFFSSPQGEWVKAIIDLEKNEVEKFESASPSDPIVDLVAPVPQAIKYTTGKESIFMMALVRNLDTAKIKAIYFTNGDEILSPQITGEPFSFMYSIQESDVDTTMEISATIVTRDNREFTSNTSKVRVFNPDAPAPNWGVTWKNFKATTGELSTFTLNAGAKAEISLASGALPDGIELVVLSNGDVLLTGRPTTAGKFTCVLLAENGKGRSTVIVTYDVLEGNLPVLRNAPTTLSGSINNGFSFVPQVSDPTFQTTFTLTGELPQGLTFDSTRGIISGTITPGSDSYTPPSSSRVVLTLTNSFGSVDYEITILIN